MSEELNASVTVDDFLLPEESAQQPSLQAEIPTDEDGLIEELAAQDEGAEPEQSEEAEIPPPPNSWSKEDAAAWVEMPPAAREVVQRREAERDRGFAEMGRKNAEARRQVEQQALEAVAQHADNFAQQLAAYAQQNAPQPPDPRLLYTGNQDDVLLYQRQDAAHRAGLAQQHELQQRIAQSQQQAEAARAEATKGASVAEAQRLQETLPEFFDPTEGPKLRQMLESIGSELGYPPDLMAQAGATDIMALKTAAEWRDKATKYDKIVAKRMESVRAAKTMPRMTRPTSDQSSVASAGSQDATEAALAQFRQDRSGAAAIALLGIRKTR